MTMTITEIEQTIAKMIADLQKDSSLSAKLRLEALDQMQKQIEAAKQQIIEALIAVLERVK
jgi:hypothetical protein